MGLEDTLARASWRTGIYILLVVALGCYTMTMDLDRGTLAGDEAMYAGITDNVLDNGDWIYLIGADGNPYFSKPPLAFWLAATTRDLFEDGPLRYKLWSSILAVVSVVLTLLLGARLFSPEVGFLAASMLAVHQHWVFGRFAHWFSLDPQLVACTLVVYLGAWAAIQGRAVLGWTLVGLAAGALSLTKPLMGVPYVIGMMVLVPLLAKPGSRRKSVLLGLGALVLCLALIVPWNAAMYLHYGKIFWVKGPGYDLVDRVSEGLKGKEQPWWFFLSTITSSFLPFIMAGPSLLFGMVMAFRKERWRSWIFLIVIVVLLLAGISASASKVKRYAYPVYPMLAIAVAAASWRVVAHTGRWGPARFGVAVRVVVIGVAFGAASVSAVRTVNNELEYFTAKRTYLPWFFYGVAKSDPETELDFYSHPGRENGTWEYRYYGGRMKGIVKTYSEPGLDKLKKASRAVAVILPTTDEGLAIATELQGSGFAAYLARKDVVAVRGLDLSDHPWLEHVRLKHPAPPISERP